MKKLLIRFVSRWVLVDVFWHVLAIGTVLFVFAIQYVLCVKAKKRKLTYLPFVYVLLALVAAYFSYVFQFRGMGIIISGIFCDYACFCLVAILLAWLLAWTFVLRKRSSKSETRQKMRKNIVKRKHLVIFVAVMLGLVATFLIKWELGYRRPYKDLERSDLIGIDIVYGGWEPHQLNEEEMEAVLDILDDLVLYRKLLYQDPGEGWHTEQFVLHYVNGRAEVISGSSTGLRKDHLIRLIAKDVYSLGDMCIDHVLYRSTLESKELEELWAKYRKIYYGN